MVAHHGVIFDGTYFFRLKREAGSSLRCLQSVNLCLQLSAVNILLGLKTLPSQPALIVCSHVLI